MNILKTFCVGVILGSLASHAAAVTNPLSVHVLNLQDGLPSPDVKVTLEKQDGPQWTLLNSEITNAQGRITALYPADKPLKKGTYRITFETGEWFSKRQTQSFFPQVPVIIAVDGTQPHYHVPLLISPYGFSTYRGN